MDQADRGSSKYVLFLGDSHTEAWYGASFVDLLRPALQGLGKDAIASGINAELADVIGSRLGPLLDQHGPPAAAVILAGTNNVIAASYRLYYRMYVQMRKTRRPPKLEVYRDSLTRMLQLLQQRAPSCKVFLITLPPVTEVPTSPLWASVATHNKIIAEVAAGFSNAAVVDFNAACVQYLQQHTSRQKSLQGNYLDLPVWRIALLGVNMLLRNKVFGQSWNSIAAIRGRLLLHDDVHLNNKAAHLLAAQLQPVLQTALSK